MMIGWNRPHGAGVGQEGVSVSAENVQVLRNAYDAFARQDVAAVMAAFDEGIEWQVPESLPFGGTYRGRDGVGEFFGSLPGHFSDLSVEPQEFIDGGDTIVVLVRVAGAGAAGPLDQTHVHLWRMRGGKATTFTEFGDTARTLAALGQTAPTA
jgi:uncharacterized protein